MLCVLFERARAGTTPRSPSRCRSGATTPARRDPPRPLLLRPLRPLRPHPALIPVPASVSVPVRLGLGLGPVLRLGARHPRRSAVRPATCNSSFTTTIGCVVRVAAYLNTCIHNMIAELMKLGVLICGCLGFNLHLPRAWNRSLSSSSSSWHWLSPFPLSCLPCARIY